MLPHLLLLAALASPAPQDTAHIVLVSTTDVHGRAYGWDYITDRPFPGGLARAATVVDSLRAQYPGQVVVLDAGDLIQGNSFAAYFAREAPRDTNPIIRAMNLVGYDAAALGNHEFNWGLETLGDAIAGAAFPYVSGNVYALPADTLVHRPFTVVERQGVRIGIAGFTTPGVMVWDRENVRGKVRVGPVEPAALTVLEQLDKAADLSVVLIHSGMDGPASYDTAGVGPENVAARLAYLPHRPDFVLVGHSHREMRDSVLNGTHFVQPRNWAQSVSVMHVDLVSKGGQWRAVRWRADAVRLDSVTPSARVVAALQGAHDSVRQWVTQPLGHAVGPMPAALSRAEPTPIIGFIHDVQMKRTGAQLSAASAFDLQAGFDTGPIRLSDVAGIYPYENTLRAVRITGAQLDAFLEQSARYYRVDSAGRVSFNDSIPGYNFDMIGGASYTIDLTRPLGNRIQDLAVSGRAVTATDTFTLAVNSYRQGGGGGFDMLQDAPVVYDENENIRDLLVEAVRERKRIDPREYADTNWRFIPSSAAEQVRALHMDRVRPHMTPRPHQPPSRRAAEPPSVRLRILAITDLHGALQPAIHSWSNGRPAGGIVAIDALMDSLEAACDCPTIRLDGGDQMQGTLISNLSYGRSTVAALNLLDLDAAVIGNHDLDWSPDTLRARMRQADYAWLAANVFDSTTGRRPEWVTPYRIIEVDSLRVAVIGYMSPETKSIVKAEHVRGLVFRAGAAPIKDVFEAAVAEVPDAIIIVAHAGAVCDTVCEGDIIDLARELPEGSVDAIVAGHTHWPYEAVVNGIPIVQARSSGSAVGVIDLTTHDPTTHDAPHINLLTPYADTPGDTALAALVARFSKVADSLADRVITRLAQPLPKGSESGQYALGNLIADAQRATLNADVAIMNNGGIRGRGLPAGPVTYGRLYELQPFGNGIVTVTVTGAILRQAIEHVLNADGTAAHISGLRVRYDPAKRRGHRITVLQLEDGRPVHSDSSYKVAINDYMAGGGSGYTMFVGQPARASGMTDLDALIEYLEKRPQPVEAPMVPRIRPVD